MRSLCRGGTAMMGNSTATVRTGGSGFMGGASTRGGGAGGGAGGSGDGGVPSLPDTAVPHAGLTAELCAPTIHSVLPGSAPRQRHHAAPAGRRLAQFLGIKLRPGHTLQVGQAPDGSPTNQHHAGTNHGSPAPINRGWRDRRGLAEGVQWHHGGRAALHHRAETCVFQRRAALRAREHWRRRPDSIVSGTSHYSGHNQRSQ